MDNLKKLSHIVLLATLVSCNETVSPELKDSGVTGQGSKDGTVVPDEYFIEVKNTSPALLNYQLHRTGEGHFKSKCRVSSKGVQLSNGLFTAEGNSSIDHDDKQFDITCYYDMEELALYFNGFKFEISSSPNTCEYISYAPFSFYDRKPGSSTTSITRVTCSDDITDANARTHLAGAFPASMVQDSTATVVACDQQLDTGLSATLATNTVQDLVEEEELCRFDYSDEEGVEGSGMKPGKNCDIGVIDITDISVSSSVDPLTSLPMITSTAERTKKRCGGAIRNCLEGPALDIGGINALSEIHPTVENKSFKTEYTYKGGIEREFYSSLFYANFRAPLANKDLDFQDTAVDLAQAVWTTNTNRKKFDPTVMQFYSTNRYHKSNRELVTAAEWNAASVVNGYTARPYAADPFLGMGGWLTSPFYQVTCLDSAFDVKARIRIVVRDWDRVFTSSPALENITDYRGNHFIAPSGNRVSRQDNPADQEIIGEISANNNFNDTYDWDNWIPMQRTAGNYVTQNADPNLDTVWRPISSDALDPLGDRRTDLVTYPEGFFSPTIFTNGFY